MNKLMRFENSNVQILEIDGVWYFELYSVGAALGYVRSNGKSTGEHGVHPSKEKLFPYKSRIDKLVENAEIKPVVRNAHKYITEEQIYDLMLEARTEKCKLFRKWLTNEVLPTLRKTGEYKVSAASPEPDSKPYEYFDKTYNGAPVLSSIDIEHLTGIKSTTVDSYLSHKAKAGKDFFRLTGKELAKFKTENPKMSTNISCLYVITREGFIKLCRDYGIKVEEPKCFEPQNQQIKLFDSDTMFRCGGEDFFFLGKSSLKLLEQIAEDAAAIKSIVGYIDHGMHKKSSYEAARTVIYDLVRNRMLVHASDFTEIFLDK